MADKVRKSLGEAGSRKQTVVVFLLLLVLGLVMYLPSRWKAPDWRVKLPQWSGGDVITIRKSGWKATSPRPRPQIEALLTEQTGDYSILVKSLTGQEEIMINEHQVMTAASVIKLPVLVVYYQAVDSGQLDPGEIYILAEADRWEYGTGSMQYQAAGTKYTYQEIAKLVANQSDNMGAEVLIKKLGGYTKVQQAIDKLGLTKTNLKANEITVADAGNLFLQLAQGKLLSQASREGLFNNLTKTINEDRLPAGVPENIRVIHKFGSEVGVVNDCGLVEASNPYIICVLTTEVNVGEAEAILPQISKLVWGWLGD
ncbi:MAG: serine hydrolase [Patescibacteria group bacterium]|nr:serine hydrolase [Candidatus Beckwithbacteria bacterium]MDZ4228733.1 serine hydrolase [Patescibacteria group bacterium]